MIGPFIIHNRTYLWLGQPARLRNDLAVCQSGRYGRESGVAGFWIIWKSFTSTQRSSWAGPW